MRRPDGEINAVWRLIGEVQGIPVRRYALSPDSRNVAIALEGASAEHKSRLTSDDARVETTSDPDDKLLLLAVDGSVTPRRFLLPGSVWSLNWNHDGRHLAIVAGTDDDRRGPMHSLLTLDTVGQDVQPVAGIAPRSARQSGRRKASPISHAVRRTRHPIAARCSPATLKAGWWRS